MNRIRNVDNIVFVFPIWWHNIPAMLKGYIDRVFNYGFAYGSNKLPVDKIRWIGLAGESRSSFHLNIEHQLNIGISGFVGVDDSEVELFYDTLVEEVPEEKSEKHYAEILNRSYLIGKEI